MKKLFLLVVLLHTLFAFSQAQSVTDLPTITPPSPTAYQMTQYGDVAVNEATGNISPSIPLYTYQAGRLQLPIGLNYQGNAVKVDQAAGWTGINWNLNAGGVITRLVRDLDDFTASSRKMYTQSEFNNLLIEEKHLFIINSGIDSEVDLFSFSFPGYSGSFYLTYDDNDNFVANLTKNDTELQIEVSDPPVLNGITEGLKREIVITVPNGVKYFFGGINASENSGIYVSVFNGGTKYAQTSFYLNRILHPLGDEIYFTYSPKSYSIKTAKSQRRKIYIGDYGGIGCSFMPENYYFDENVLNKINGTFLNKIESSANNVSILFNSLDAPNQVSGHFINVLKSIDVKDNNQLFKKFNLDYLFPKDDTNEVAEISDSQRFFLEKVSFSNSLGSEEYNYRMVYDTPEELPNRFDFGQDHLGYYNGANNTTLLPKNNHTAFESVNETLADRGAVFDKAKLGSLKKIYYPTAGHSTFEYEDCGVYESNTNFEEKHNFITAYQNDTYITPVNKNIITIHIPEMTMVPIGETPNNDILISQNVKFKLKNVFSTNQIDFHTQFWLKITRDSDGYEVFNEKIIYDENDPDAYDDYMTPYGAIRRYPMKEFNNVYLNAGNKYTIEFKIHSGGYTIDSLIKATLDYNYKIESVNSGAFGVRVKEIKNFDKDDETAGPTSQKNYFYEGVQEYIRPAYLYESKDNICCLTSNGVTFSSTTKTVNYINLEASSISSLFMGSSNQIAYKKVKVFNSRNSLYSNGYVENEFFLETDSPCISVLNNFYNERTPQTGENLSAINGTLKKKVFYTRKDNKYIPIKEIEYVYGPKNDVTGLEYNNFVVNNVKQKMWDKPNNACNDILKQVSHLYMGIYRTYSHDFILKKIIEKNYDYSYIIPEENIDTDNDGENNFIDNDDDNDGTLDTNDTDDDGDGILDVNDVLGMPKILQNTIDYEYEQHIGLPTIILKSSSDTDLVHITNNSYPEIDNNIATHISEPNMTSISSKKDDNLKRLSTTMKLYSNYNNLSKKFLSKISSIKGEYNLDNTVALFEEGVRIIYHKYDDKGNPIELSKADGVHILYIWGYNQTKPIAKIINATYQEVAQYVTNLQTLSNNDTDRTLDYIGAEGALRQALNQLRTALPNAQLSTFTYDPLIGTTSTTDPRGYTSYYYYDEFHRLQYVKDAEGNILSENEYNYRTQN